MKQITFFIAALVFSNFAMANAYKCAKMVYSDGWLIDYEYLGNTWGANTKKHGALSSTFGSSIEKTTSSVDPGVYTGQAMSSMQYSSSWGDCSMLDYHITKKIRKDYIEQNIHEIRKQIALGHGIHIDSLAFLSGCKGIEQNRWLHNLRQNTEIFYEAENADGFVLGLDSMIQSDRNLNRKCQMPQELS
tara:strand:- start:3724 stop:4290 length:567 start_codon:yes stop_codon:yes gene_type:complete